MEILFNKWPDSFTQCLGQDPVNIKWVAEFIHNFKGETEPALY